MKRLSRGLFEALTGFIGRASGHQHFNHYNFRLVREDLNLQE
jgi:hypothetical protein